MRNETIKLRTKSAGDIVVSYNHIGEDKSETPHHIYRVRLTSDKASVTFTYHARTYLYPAYRDNGKMGKMDLYGALMDYCVFMWKLSKRQCNKLVGGDEDKGQLLHYELSNKSCLGWNRLKGKGRES